MFLTICNLVSPLGPILLKKMDVSILLGIGLLVMNISVLCLSFVKSFWAFIIIYAAIMPAGRGLYFYVFHQLVWEWFPQCKGLVTGIILAGVGVGSLIFSPLSAYFVNNENGSPILPYPGANELMFPKNIADRVPRMWQYLFICWASLSLFGWLTITRNPKYLNS